MAADVFVVVVVVVVVAVVEAAAATFVLLELARLLYIARMLGSCLYIVLSLSFG